MPETIEVEVERGIATVVLNRPDVRNAFNATMILELTQVFADIARRVDVRVVVLRGAGKSFSAGADVNWMRASLDYSREENLADALRMSDMFAAIEGVPQPVVCGVHGAALGGGMGLLAACDVVIAEAGAVFGFTETKLGIIPAVISRVVLAKIGASWARALYTTGERFSAEVAQRIGLVHWVTPASELDGAIQARVDELCRSGPEAVRHAKALVRDGAGLDDAALRALTAERIATVRVSDEGQEGLRAFLEKRRPIWLPGE